VALGTVSPIVILAPKIDNSNRLQIGAVVEERRRLSGDVEQKRATLLATLDRFNATRATLSATAEVAREQQQRYSAASLCDMLQRSSVADEESSEQVASL
jgi:membrane-associated HD superfamily phosphohydrolase